MARYLDQDDLEVEEPRRDTEVTLSWGMLLGIGVALLAICAVCFWLGYTVGHSGRSSAGPAAPTASQQNAPDQEPLQGSGSVPKPSATAQAPVAQPPQASGAAPPPEQNGNPEAAAPSPAQATVPAAAPVAAPPAQPQVRPAMGNSAPVNPQMQAATTVRPALPSANSPMVQVAAVRNEEDASVLTNALRRRGYPVAAHRDVEDGLIHVRVGPFPTRDEANQWRMKLLNDGYNALVQP